MFDLTKAVSIKLKYPKEDSFLNAVDFIRRELDTTSNIPQLDDEGEKDLRWRHKGPIRIMLDEKIFDVTNVQMPVTFIVKYYSVTTLSVKSYRSDEDEVIGEEVSVRFDAESHIVKCQAVVTKKNGEVEVIGDNNYEYEEK